ncbi:MAG: Rne/Rng family ribonuclease, partial [Pseudomonadota bacterium]
GNIYLARVTRVEPSLQAAFVEYGGNRHGFLAFGEIHPDYYQIPVADRDVLRAAEALEAELAAKLAELDDDAIDIDDDDNDPDDGTEAGDTEDVRGDTRADSEDEEDSRPRRGRGRRRRGGRGRGRRNRKDDDTSSETAEADAEATTDGATDTDDSADNTDVAPLTTAAAVVAGETDADSTDDVQPAEDLGWHGVDADVLDSLPKDDVETVTADSQDITIETGAGAENDDDNDDDDSEPDNPKSIALSARTEPHLTEDLPEDSGNDSSGDEAEPEPKSEAAADDDKDSVPDTSEAGESDEAHTDEDENKDTAEEEASAEPEEPAEPTEEELEARRKAEELADLQKRYDAARRDRDRLLKNYRIQEVIKRRQIMLVQVVKEERGNKGAALTTFMSLAGRYGVLMPNNSRGGGVSRKISNQSDRRRLRKAIADLDVPKGQGLIIRTAGAKRTKAEIKRDYDYLARLWDTIRAQTLKSVAPCCIYEEASLIKRAIRDLYDKDTSEVLVEGEEGYREAKDFMKMLMPSHAKNVQPYRDLEPLFLRHGVERQLDEMYQPTVQLKSGGYLVIQQTEALISVDVNSGKATKERNVEATALKTNSEAAAELARQCRLRDLAGLIVVDFIDMDENRNNRTVEKKFKDALKADRARIQIGSISNFGLLEMSRQRRRSGIVDGTTRLCPTCDGAGNVRSVEMAALRILRGVEEKAVSDRAAQVTCTTSQDVALYILNQKRGWLNRMESSYGVSIEILGDHDKTGDQYEVQTSGKAQALDTLRQSAAVEVGDVTIEHDDAADEETGADNDTDDTSERQDESRATDEDDKPKRKRRRRRRGKGEDKDRDGETAGDSETAKAAEDGDEDNQNAKTDASDEESDGEPKKKRRRGRRGGRGRKNEERSASDGEDRAKDAGADAGDDAKTSHKDDTGQTSPEGTQASADSSPDDAAGSKGSSPEPEAPKAPEPVADEEPKRAASSIHAPLPEAEKAKKAPKRGGWWQRALGLDEK